MNRKTCFRCISFFAVLMLMCCIGHAAASADSAAEIEPAAWTVYVDGAPVENAAYTKGGVLYMKLSDVAKALGSELTVSGTDFSFPWRKSTVSMGAGPGCLNYNDGLVVFDGETYLSDDGGDLFVPAEPFFKAIQVGVYEDAEESTVYFTPGAGDWIPAGGYNVPVFMYHGVGHADLTTNLILPPEHLEEQLQYLLDNGFTPIWFEDLWHVEDFEKPVILIFDDGMENLYRYMMPILEKYGCKATVAIVQHFTSETQPAYLSPDRVVEMQETGLISFQSHTYSHRMLEVITDEEQVWEMDEAQRFITRLTKREPFVLIYPSGSQNDATLAIIGNYYNYGVKMHHKPDNICYNTSSDPRMIYRYFVQSFTPLSQFAGWLEEAESSEPVIVKVDVKPVGTAASVAASLAAANTPENQEAALTEEIETVYYGDYNGNPVRWTVLNVEERNDGEAGMYLLSTYVLEQYGTQYHPSVAGWQGSSAQQWCRDFYDASFSGAEKAAIPAVSLTEESSQSFALTWRETSLENECVFFLSAPELSRYYGAEFSPGISAKLTDGKTTSYYWLRTSHNYHPDYAGLVLQGGEVHDCQVANRQGARPAMNLDPDSILIFSPAYTDAPAGEVKATVIDPSRSFTAAADRAAGDVLTVTYSGAEVGDGEYICAVALDGNGKCTAIVRLKASSEAEGRADIPQTLIETSASVAVANIRMNGDYRTDFSSPLSIIR